ncbi:MAG TPA: hypothetical protein VHB21_04340, partial [Minicystis sp.]|nr:hypothetical protein [Minicystis sp.]
MIPPTCPTPLNVLTRLVETGGGGADGAGAGVGGGTPGSFSGKAPSDTPRIVAHRRERRPIPAGRA